MKRDSVKIDVKQIARLYRKFNRLWFNEWCPSQCIVTCGDNPPKGYRRGEVFSVSWVTRDAKKRVVANIWFDVTFNNLVIIQQSLLHEMAHIFLESQCGIGMRHSGQEGTRFEAEIRRLFSVGAYEGLL